MHHAFPSDVACYVSLIFNRFDKASVAGDVEGCARDSSRNQKEELEDKMVVFLRCLQAALAPKLCPGCISKYWNMFRYLDVDKLRVLYSSPDLDTLYQFGDY